MEKVKTNKSDEASSSRPGTHYNMNHKNRGIALIFNHEKFESHLELANRQGTNEDVACMKPMLTELGFTVVVHTNNKVRELKGEIRKAAEHDHTDYDCFVMVVLTHGGAIDKLYAKDSYYSLENLWLPFTAHSCPTLAGKPKLFFISADREESKIPPHADFLFAYSSAPGSLSWRNIDTGTWFIQALCRVFKNHAYEYDILSLMTLVHQSIASDSDDYFDLNKLRMDQKNKQIPYVTSSLTHLVQFNRKFRTLNTYLGKSDIELSFEPNQIITDVRLLRCSGWVEGTLDGKIGVLPLNFLEEFVDKQKCSLSAD